MSISTCALREEGNRLLKAQKEGKLYISIHALREEGDRLLKAQKEGKLYISIHALREEGDSMPRTLMAFLALFLSTPSARRATSQLTVSILIQLISIHALREEGDMHGADD